MGMANYGNPLLSEAQLEAFYGVAVEGSFTRATHVLNLSQPALTRRIQGLEEALEITLFDRTPQGVALTEAGHKLLLYVKTKRALESEALADLRGAKEAGELGGLIRIAGHSSIIEPVVMPAIAPFLKVNPSVQIEFSVRVNAHLDEMLNYSKTDFIVANREGQRKDVVQTLLGEEEFICIESSSPTSRSHVYLDVDPTDTITESFFEAQSNPPKKYARSFMHDENGIMTGVQLGLGRAIKPKHTLKNTDSIRMVKGFASMKRPVYLRYSRKSYYTRLERAVIEVMEKEVPKILR